MSVDEAPRPPDGRAGEAPRPPDGRAGEAPRPPDGRAGEAPRLRVEGLRARLGGRAVLCGVELTLRAGQVLGLVGPNGAGKTTCMRALTGQLIPEAGGVWLDGRRLAPRLGLAQRARLGIGYLPQHPSAFGGLTTWENLRAVPGASAAACEAVLAAVGLEARAQVMAASLSGGERRRLEVGRLMLLPLRVLLGDEPFAALDPRGVTAVAGLLRAVAARGAAVLVTDHQVEALFGCCDEVALLLDGQVARQGTPEALRADPVLRARYL